MNMSHHANMSLNGTHTFMTLFGKFFCSNFRIVFNLLLNPHIKIITYRPIYLSATLGAILSATKPLCSSQNISCRVFFYPKFPLKAFILLLDGRIRHVF